VPEQPIRFASGVQSALAPKVESAALNNPDQIGLVAEADLLLDLEVGLFTDENRVTESLQQYMIVRLPTVLPQSSLSPREFKNVLHLLTSKPQIFLLTSSNPICYH